ncbi:hypothetical protein LJR289_000780 [Pseudoduganella sp. LjRoot289]|uniref:cupredoxin domain-containing protein n=1 Tax=Pseudoduganella sp. LjRoot289 TaxID=3342314 RepID=UPI003ED0767C
MAWRLARRGVLSACLLAAVLAGACAGWAAWAPLALASRDQPFDIPKGTWARRMAGDPVEILPARIELTVGLNDTLLLRNLDDVPQQFGPVLIMPGQNFRLPFEQAADYQFDCTAHASGQMTVAVLPHPAPGLARLQWRLAALRRTAHAVFIVNFKGVHG